MTFWFLTILLSGTALSAALLAREEAKWSRSLLESWGPLTRSFSGESAALWLLSWGGSIIFFCFAIGTLWMILNQLLLFPPLQFAAGWSFILLYGLGLARFSLSDLFTQKGGVEIKRTHRGPSRWMMRLKSSRAVHWAARARFFGKNSPYLQRVAIRGKLSDLAWIESYPERLRAMERDMLIRLLDFSRIVAKEVMVPLVEVAAVPGTETAQGIVKFFHRHSYTRLPVYEETLENIVGIVDLFDVLAVIEKSETPVKSLMRLPHYVPETCPVDELLLEMQRMNLKMAVIVDEFGTAIGIVTIEDILEEIVGEISDEYEERPEWYKEIRKNVYLVSARAKVDKLNEELQCHIPEGDYETLAGFLLEQFKKIPSVGEKAEINGVVYAVQKVTNRTIEQVKITVPLDLPISTHR